MEVLRMRKDWGSRSGGAALGLLLAACSGDVVDLGGGEQGLAGEGGPVCGRAGVASGDFYVGTQSALRQLEGCREIQGSLLIGQLDQADLSPLSELTRVDETLWLGAFPFENVEASWPGIVRLLGEGELEPRDTPSSDDPVWYPSLAGLGSLESVRVLQLEGIGASDLSELSSLRGVGDTLWIAIAPRLSDLSALEGVVIHGLYLLGVPELVSLRGFEVPADHQLTELTISTAPQLVDITALAGLEMVDGPVSLSGTGLETLDGLSGLGWTTGGLSISRNDALVDITGLDQLVETTFLVVDGNPKLERVPEFSRLERLQSLVLTGNDALQDFTPEMPELEFSLGRARNLPFSMPWRLLQVDSNPRLTRFAMPRRADALEEVYVRANDSLQELDLGGIQTLDLLFISRNPSLDNVVAPWTQTVDKLTVMNNPLLSLAAFADMKTFVTTASGNADEPAQ
jgi:hypothetical protein